MKFILLGLLFVSLNLQAQTVTVKTTENFIYDAIKLTTIKNYDGAKPLNFREFSFFVQDGQPFIAVLSEGGKTAYPVELNKNYAVYHSPNGHNTYLSEEKEFSSKNYILDYSISFNPEIQFYYILTIIKYEFIL